MSILSIRFKKRAKGYLVVVYAEFMMNLLPPPGDCYLVEELGTATVLLRYWPASRCGTYVVLWRY